MRQSGLFGLSDHMKRLSADGDPLEVLAQVIGFEAFHPTLLAALSYSDGAKGGRPPYDPVVMLKVLVLAAQNNVSDARMALFARARPPTGRATMGGCCAMSSPTTTPLRTYGRTRLIAARAMSAG